jgi:hypothetical protein
VRFMLVRVLALPRVFAHAPTLPRHAADGNAADGYRPAGC